MILEKHFVKWLDHWHGNGESHQWRYYRCDTCRHLVTHHMIARGGCPCGGTGFLRPAKLTRKEKIQALVLPWTVNRYHDE